jgi:hypothetical protein
MLRALRFSIPLRPGDRIGVPSPWAGVQDHERERINSAVSGLRAAGYEVTAGRMMNTSGTTAGPSPGAGGRAYGDTVRPDDSLLGAG